MPLDHTYSPAELCDMLNLSKSTLFRWERQGALPPATRDLSDQRHARLYTDNHARALVQEQYREVTEQLEKHKALVRQKDHSATSATDEGAGSSLMSILQVNALRKLLAGDVEGLKQLRAFDRLQPKILRALLRAALEDCALEDENFCDILEVVLEQSRKLRPVAAR